MHPVEYLYHSFVNYYLFKILEQGFQKKIFDMNPLSP